MQPAQRMRWSLVAALIVGLLGACDQTTAPTATDAPPGTSKPSHLPTDDGSARPLSDRARFVDPAEFPLVSTPADLAAGRYRFQLNGGSPGAVSRDDYLVTADPEPIVRLVLASVVRDGVLTVETGPARWSDVLRSGTYGVHLPLVPGASRAMTTDAQSLQVGPESQPIPPMEKTFHRTDVCAWIDSALAKVPGSNTGPLCGTEKTFSKSVPDVVTVTVGGTIDSLLILGGSIAVNGGVDMTMTLDAGGISGGHAPVFYPCDRAAYPGCLTTPTGAALIDFFHQYAPTVPDSALPPVRVCVPKSPIRVRRAYWTRSGLTPTYHPAVYAACSVTDVGVLPTITYPSITNVQSHIDPHIQGSLTFKATANGSLSFEIPIPEMAVSAKYSARSDSTSTALQLTAEAKAGVFLYLSFTLKNAGAVVHTEFNDSGVVAQQWTEGGGWDGGYTRVLSERNAQLTSIPPDSAVFVLQPEVKAGAKLCLLVCGGSDTTKADTTAADTTSFVGRKLLQLLKIEADAGAALEKPTTLTWSRKSVDPTDTAIDDWHVAVDDAYKIPLNAGLSIPGKRFVAPAVPTDWKKELTFDTVHVEDLWGRGNVRVETTTTGAGARTDPYVVTVSRADTFPVVIASPAQARRKGSETDHGPPLQMTVVPNGSALLASGIEPCKVYYSDATIANTPVAGAVVHGLRAEGVGIPNYATPSFCDLLIARYRVTLGNVPGNCTVAGGAVRDSVWLDSRKRSIGRSDTTTVAFNVTCDGTAPTGDLRLTTAAATTPDYAADYVLRVDSLPWGLLGPDTTVSVTGLLAGSHTLHFAGGPTNCIVLDSLVVTIPAAGTDTVRAQPICQVSGSTPPPGEVAVAATTTGAGGDPSGYLLDLDGVASASTPDNGEGKLENVPALVPSVIQVTDIAGNCRPGTPNPFVVALDSAADPITVPFAVTCTDAAVDSLTGTIESAGYPSPSVALRSSDGTVLALSGGVAEELAQLAGMSVRVWGVRTGTTLDAYGYDLVSTLEEPRWVGIVEPRGSDLWLFGRTAVKLVDAPPDLAADVGALVWVTGSAAGDAVTPTAFGLIRGPQP